VVPALPLVLLTLLADGTPAPAASAYDRDVQATIVTYCSECHGGGSARGDVDFDRFRTDADRRQAGALWTRVWENVRNGYMPPPGSPRPGPTERARLQTWIQREVQGVDCRAPDPGRVTIRRLNRDEYNHSVADLFGVDFRPADDFPPDDTGYGFDNIGEVLAMSPLLAEKYFNAAEQVVARVVATRPELPRRVIGRDDLKPVEEPAARLTVSEARFQLEHGGRHAVELKLSVNSFRPFKGQARVRVQLDDRELLRSTYVAGNRLYRHRYRIPLGRGEHRVRFTLDLRDAIPDAGRSITIALDELSVTGPVGSRVREYPAAHRRLFFQGPPPRPLAARQAYARTILTPVAERAFRRPVEPQTMTRLLELAAAAERQTGRFEDGIAHALQAILTSPRFLFRIEDAPGAAATGPAQPLDDHTLAARLSALLLGSVPDDPLWALASKGQLRPNLGEQVRRLLRDPRSERFVSRFVGQWLQTRDMDTVIVNGDGGRAMTPALRRLMRAETEALFAHVMREDRDVLELLTADYSFLNATLAGHYGIEGVQGPALRRVALPAGSHRGGLLTHGSFLAVTSNPTRTSPVKRGLFVLDNLLGAAPPPPPPNVPNLDEPRKGEAPRSMREQLEQHRRNPGCAACHLRMDPLGLALERFDALGRWREAAAGEPPDAAERLSTGESVAGVDGVRAMLVTRREQFYRTLTRKLLTFALGRGLRPADECTVDALVTRMGAEGGRLSGLLVGIVESPPFQSRRVALPLAQASQEGARP
jgi:hypothetical protein